MKNTNKKTIPLDPIQTHDLYQDVNPAEMPETELKPIETTKKINPIVIILVLVFVTLFIVGFFAIQKAFSKPGETTTTEDTMFDEIMPQVDKSIIVTLGKSKTQENAVLIEVKGLNAKYKSIGYELQYDSEGVGKGVTSGSKPIDVAGKDIFERDIYLGTCSRNVCKPDLGIEKVSVVLVFTDINDKRSQYTEEFEL